MQDSGPSLLTRCMRWVAAFMGLGTVVAAVALAAVTEPAAITLDLMFSITGFCAGFLYASYLYDPRVRLRGFRNRPVGPMRSVNRTEQGQRSAE